MVNDIKEILLNEEEIAKIVNGIAEKINEDYKDKNLLLVCVLKGSVCFMSDLMKAIKIPCRIDFMAAKSYGSSTETSGVVNITYDLKYDIQDYDLLIVEDIFDSGRTLEKLTENLLEEYKDIPIVYAGGVMSCSVIKKQLSKYGSFALPAFSADNAAGIALLCRKQHLKI